MNACNSLVYVNDAVYKAISFDLILLDKTVGYIMLNIFFFDRITFYLLIKIYLVYSFQVSYAQIEFYYIAGYNYISGNILIRA